MRICLVEVGKRIRATYGVNLAAGAAASVDNLLDNNIETYWQADDKAASFTVTLPAARKINRVMLQEAVSEVGQRVKEHAVDAWVNGQWKQVAAATTIGYKKILRFDSVTTDKFRLRILDARKAPAIASFAAHYYQSPPLPVKVKRGDDGSVSLFGMTPDGKPAGDMTSYYTLDDSEPDKSSTLYEKPFALPKGGRLKACTFADGTYGPVESVYLGLPKSGWKVTADSAHADQWSAEKAVDGNAGTFWHTSWNQPAPNHPHTFTVDLGKVENISGFAYLPRQDRRIPDGMIETGSIELSLDGQKWTKVCDFTFGNLVNSPDQRLEFFDKKHKARYFRLKSKTGAAGKPYAAIAELEIFAH